jgi:aspartyl-tRNA(Asn)/glutamyl-tRNA(Gln) amidotransferase subunit A
VSDGAIAAPDPVPAGGTDRVQALVEDGVRAIGEAIARGECSATDVARACLDRITACNPSLHALLPVDAEAVLEQARASDLRRRTRQSRGVLDGVPIVLKDLIEIEGQVSTNGSSMRSEAVSRVTAAVVERLRDAGMVILGKAHMVEFAYGGWGTNASMGAPRNPWDPRVFRSPGGSSSGSGVAVAAGMTPASLGSDTGGSIRIPAALQGLTGLKPTVGLISLHGCLPLSDSFDSIGPMTRSVADTALLTQALAGYDPRDPRSVRHDRGSMLPSPDTAIDPVGCRVIVTPEAHEPVKVQPAVRRALDAVIGELEAAGVRIEHRAPPFDWNRLLLESSRAIGAEVWARHGSIALDEHRPIDPGVRQRILRARSITPDAYRDAMRHARETGRQWSEWMGDAQAWLMPGCPISAPPIDAVDELDPILSTFTRVANHLGGCALSLPAGLDEHGLPVGVQLVGRAFGEAGLLRIGHLLQQRTQWHRATCPGAIAR